MRNVFLIALLIVASTSASAAPVLLDRAAIDRLDRLAVGEEFAVERFPDGAGGESGVRFRRIETYAPGARVIVVDADGEHELPRSARVELIGEDASGTLRVSLGFDPGVDKVSGVATTSAGTFVVTGERSANGLALRTVPVAATYPAGVVPEILGTDDSLDSGHAQPGELAIAIAGEAPAGTLRRATVAVDTDTEFMSKRFNNNTSAASSWIADLFATMNVMYERDLDVTLLQGTTMLRTASDPYVQDGLPAADQPALVEFGSYWQAHYGNIDRSFAALLSGKSPSGNQASGIAWVNSYCENQSQGGSYSFNEIFTNSQVDISLSARIVGHELGHNFGASHTHCTDATSGAAPVSGNTIDRCYAGEAGSGCYSGPVSCPTSGPGHPLGTLMSYCNVGTQNGGAGCGQNVLQFHPTHINLLKALIAQNTPSCLVVQVDLIFRNGFD